MKRVMAVFGTRPEAIKMAPVILALKASGMFDVKVCITGQHRGMLDQVLAIFDIVPDHDLNIMKPGQDLTDITSNVLAGMRNVYRAWRPEWTLVHGDTTTTLSASLASFYERIPVAHVEAGLRTHNKYSPWPEEINRHVTSVLATLHFAPTPAARQNLIEEGIAPANVEVTGNTVIDALLGAVKKLKENPPLMERFKERFSFLDPSKKLILVTCHRRENFGEGFQRVCAALTRLAGRSDVAVLYPVHLNPNVRQPVHEMLGGRKNVHLMEPLDYLPFVYLMERSYLIITDSGGIQEEAPSLGKPVLVMRDATERPEAVDAGTVRLVGTDPDRIFNQAKILIENQDDYERMSRLHNPYGDGLASDRITKRLLLGT